MNTGQAPRIWPRMRNPRTCRCCALAPEIFEGGPNITLWKRGARGLSGPTLRRTLRASQLLSRSSCFTT